MRRLNLTKISKETLTKVRSRLMTIISAVSKISIAICSQSQLLQSHKAFLSAFHLRTARKNICVHNFTAQVFVSLFVCYNCQMYHCTGVFVCFQMYHCTQCTGVAALGDELLQQWGLPENLQVFKYSLFRFQSGETILVLKYSGV